MTAALRSIAKVECRHSREIISRHFSKGIPMARIYQLRSESPEEFFLRRQFLGQLAATGAVLSVWPALAETTEEGWDEGDPLCRVADTELEERDGFVVDEAC